MKKMILVSLLATTVFSGCGSAPKAVIPDGSNRIPINQERELDSLQTRNKQEIQFERDKTIYERQIEALTRQVESVKQALITMQMNLENNFYSRDGKRKAATAIHAQEVQKIADENYDKAYLLQQRGNAKIIQSEAPRAAPGIINTPQIASFEQTGNTSIFRFFYGTGKSDLPLTPENQNKLIAMAKLATAIQINAYTDSATDDRTNQNIAKLRSDKAAKYLISQGINKDIINANSFSSGYFIVDNSPAIGKLLNRRTEITLTFNASNSTAAM
ncbi:OmpA family protein (plasmid) [Ampullimonas aquatilis]|uniref:OmpA family protein n=1 Tax=Ampullimonas aquatilis TaxID=1341549 RepID=UPI003C710BEE